tara:strand:+ start:464 stop:1948 length:1485 start_codon:yes stop_codon:yes gene_type:complete
MIQIIKNFNNLVKNTIFKVKNKTNNKSKISSFNKYLITFIGTLFIYIFYLLTPLLYDKTWLQINIERKLISEFKINISTSADISYRILPSPHFLIKNSKILINDNKNHKSVADVKNLKIFLSQKNLFNKANMVVKKIIIDKANFSLLRKELKIINNASNNQFSKKKIIISDSNIFFKDNLDEVISIIKINKAILFFDDKKQLNLFNLKGIIFGIPFILDFIGKNDSIIKKKINFEAKSLKLNIFNEFTVKNNNFDTGENIISFLNSSIKTKFDIKKKLIIFESSNSRLNSSKINYNGKLSINPFDLVLDIDLGNYRVSKLFNLNFILEEFFKSKILYNNNLSINASLLASTNLQEEIFQNAKIDLNIINGKINFDNSRFTNDKIGFFELDNSNLFLKNNELIINTDILIVIKNSKNLFSFLNTNKKSRKEVKNILINLDYEFLSKQIKFNNIKINNNEVSAQFLNVLEDFSDININNLIKSRRLINQLFNIYEG